MCRAVDKRSVIGPNDSADGESIHAARGGFCLKARRVSLIILLLWAVNVYATTVNVGLGAANLFAVLGGTAITNAGQSSINGNLGLWSGTSITGFPPRTVSGTIDAANAHAMQ